VIYKITVKIATLHEWIDPALTFLKMILKFVPFSV
jgi:hypothetical protein